MVCDGFQPFRKCSPMYKANFSSIPSNTSQDAKAGIIIDIWRRNSNFCWIVCVVPIKLWLTTMWCNQCFVVVQTLSVCCWGFCCLEKLVWVSVSVSVSLSVNKYWSIDGITQSSSWKNRWLLRCDEKGRKRGNYVGESWMILCMIREERGGIRRIFGFIRHKERYCKLAKNDMLDEKYENKIS